VVLAIQTFGDFLLLGKGKITEEVVKLIMSWRHSGFIRGGQVLKHLGTMGIHPATLQAGKALACLRLPVRVRTCLRATHRQAQTGAPHRQAPTPKRQSAARMH